MNSDNNRHSRLQSFIDHPAKSMWTLAIPIIAGMGIQTLYTIVDMIFIGKLGGDAIAAVAFNMPIFFLVLGLSFGLGSGVTASIARFIGADDKVNADNAAEHSVAMALIISAVLTTGGLLFGPQLLRMMGCTETVLPLAWEYLKVSCYGMSFGIFSMFFRSILAGEGDMKRIRRSWGRMGNHHQPNYCIYYFCLYAFCEGTFLCSIQNERFQTLSIHTHGYH